MIDGVHFKIEVWIDIPTGDEFHIWDLYFLQLSLQIRFGGLNWSCSSKGNGAHGSRGEQNIHVFQVHAAYFSWETIKANTELPKKQINVMQNLCFSRT